MIQVTIKFEGEHFVSLSIKGHAKSAPKGNDLVCAATSAVITGAFNSISDTKNFIFKLKDGDALLEAKDEVNEHDKVVIETLITGLKTIEDSNPSYMKIKNL